MMLRSFVDRLARHFGNVGSTLVAVALIAVVFEEVELYQSIRLLIGGIIGIVTTSLYLSKTREGSND